MKKQKIEMEEYLSLSHMHVSNRKSGIGLVDMALNKLGRSRKISLRSQNFLVRILNFMKNPKNIYSKIIGSTHNYEVIKTITNCLYKKCILL